MKTRTKVLIGTGIALALLIFLATRRSLWVAAIKRKWGTANPFLNEYAESTWDTYSLGGLIAAYWNGNPSWAPAGSTPGTGPVIPDIATPPINGSWQQAQDETPR